LERGNARRLVRHRGRRFGVLLLAALSAGVIGFGAPAERVRAQTAPPASPPAPAGTPASPATLTTLTPNVAPASSPEAGIPTPVPTPAATPTQPPIIVDPPAAGVMYGGTETLRLIQVLGNVTATVADPAIVDASVDEIARTLTLTGKQVGTTVVTVRDARGLERDVPVRVAYAAGVIAAAASIRVTGDPATPLFLREAALQAALQAVTARPGAEVVGDPEDVTVGGPLRTDDVTEISVPLIVQGDGLITVQGTTRVRVENFAQPSVRPRELLVSDFPETLKENGTLFSADLNAKQAERFLYFHYNPPDQPSRRIVLTARNPSDQPALVQFIEGVAGPGLNEMEVGHLSTQRFLVRLAQNEGSVVMIPGNSTVVLLSQDLPAKSVVSGLLQLHEIEGVPLHLNLLAQDASAQPGGQIPASALLVGDRPHARGEYPIPEFFFDYSYDCDDGDLQIPIG